MSFSNPVDVGVLDPLWYSGYKTNTFSEVLLHRRRYFDKRNHPSPKGRIVTKLICASHRLNLVTSVHVDHKDCKMSFRRVIKTT